MERGVCRMPTGMSTRGNLLMENSMARGSFSFQKQTGVESTPAPFGEESFRARASRFIPTELDTKAISLSAFETTEVKSYVFLFLVCFLPALKSTLLDVGKMFYPDGSSFSGYWKDGKKHRHGIHMFSAGDGSRYMLCSLDNG